MLKNEDEQVIGKGNISLFQKEDNYKLSLMSYTLGAGGENRNQEVLNSLNDYVREMRQEFGN